MRLTLRTLLAHLDGVQLESTDTGELTKKIEESEFVRNLVQRIRTSITRARLGAPKIDGQGLGHDPNTVAAYLDNTLPQDRMPDLEKICLESDVLLSEVAACHQILQIVLRQPAKVSPKLRERVYRIGDLGKAAQPEPTPAAKEAPAPPPVHEPVAGPAAPAPAAEEKPIPRKREIPDYLRETRSLGWKPVVLTILVGFLLAAVILRALGPFNAAHPVLGFLASPDENTTTVALGNGSPSDDSSPAATDPSGEGTGKPKPSVAAETDATAPDAGGAEEGTAADATQPPANNAATAPAGEGETSPAGEATESTGSAEPANPALATGASTAPAVPADVSAPPAEGANPAANPAAGPNEVASTSPTTDGTIPRSIIDSAPMPKAPPTTAPAVDIGRFISENEVLARFDPAGNAWVRLPTNSPFTAGDRVLALPAYRPKIVLASGFQITIGGGSLLELRAAEPANTAQFALEYGRAVVAPIGAIGGTVQFDLWGRHGEVTFAGPTSVMAVQLRRYRAPGVDPEAGLAHRMVEIYALGGGLQWREPSHPDQAISPGETFAFLDDARGAVAPTDQIPPWVEKNDIERTDELAAQEVQTLLPVSQPLGRSLLELAEHRKSEVRALAVRGLTYLDLFEPAVDALNDDKQKSYWDDHFNELQRSLARDPAAAREVRIAFEKVRGKVLSGDLYRLLWSYSPEDLENGGAEKLVELLSSEALDVRVLAIENLGRITGTTHLYRAELPEVRRRTPVATWRKNLAEGKIKYAEKVLMLPPRLPAEAGTE